MRATLKTLRLRRAGPPLMTALLLAAAAVPATVTAAGAVRSPYTVSVNRTSLVAGSTGNSLTFSFVATNKAGDGGIRLQIPTTTAAFSTQWPAPQKTNPANAGYVTLNAGSCKSATLGSITGSGPWTINVTAKCPQFKGFSITYGAGGKVTAPTKVETSTFTSTVADKGVFVNVPTQPTVRITPAAAFVVQVDGINYPDGAIIPGVYVAVTADVSIRDRFGNVVTSDNGTANVHQGAPAFQVDGGEDIAVSFTNGLGTASFRGYPTGTFVAIDLTPSRAGLSSNPLGNVYFAPTPDVSTIRTHFEESETAPEGYAMWIDTKVVGQPGVIAAVRPVFVAESGCESNGDGTCDVDVTGTTLGGSTFSSTISLTPGKNVESDTVQPAPAIEEGDDIVISGCFSYESSLDVAVLFEVPDAGIDIRVFENTCADVQSDFAHIDVQGGTVQEGTSFLYTTESKVVVYAVLATGGMACTNLDQHYDINLRLCVDD